MTLAIEQLKEYKEGGNDNEYDTLIALSTLERAVIPETENIYPSGGAAGDVYQPGVVDVPDTFAFVISKSEIAKLDDEAGLDLRCRNLRITSASIEKA